MRLWSHKTDSGPCPALLQDAQRPPEPDIRRPPRTQPPEHSQQATTSHQSHRVYRADADPWASRDQRRVDEAERWGETVGMRTRQMRRENLYEA